MVRYFYAFTPLVIVGAVLVLSAPWLALFALAIFSLVAIVALAALLWAVVFVPYMLSRAVGRRLHIRSGAGPRTAPALPLARREKDSVWQGAPSHAAALSAAREPHAPHYTFPVGHVS